MQRLFVYSIVVVLVLGLSPGTRALAQDTDVAGDSADSAPVIPRGPLEMPSILEENARPKEVTFDWPGVDNFLEPWTNWKSTMADDHGFRLGVDYQPLAQWSNNSFGFADEDSGFGGIFRAFTSWDIWGRDNPSRTGTFELQFENRSKIGSGIPPEDLAPNFGWVGVSAADWNDAGWGVPRFMLRQRLDIGDTPIEVNVGRMIPFSQFDVTILSDNLTLFTNNSIIFNPTVAYPAPGSWGASAYVGIPKSNFYAVGIIQDANGQFDEFEPSGDGEYFKGFEFGWSGLSVSSGLAYLVNNLHAALWHIDSDSYGAALTGSWNFDAQRMGVFGRVGWAKEGARSVYQRYAAAGLTKSVYKDSQFGIGLSWGTPQIVDEDQVATEIFYRWQMSQNLALTPSVQFLFNPALNPDDDTVTVIGIRIRLTL